MKYQHNYIEWCEDDTDASIRYRKKGPSYITEDGIVRFSNTHPGLVTYPTYNRVIGPSSIHPSGFALYTANHVLHRTTGPARILADGAREYYVHGNEVPPNEYFLKYGVL